MNLSSHKVLTLVKNAVAIPKCRSGNTASVAAKSARLRQVRRELPLRVHENEERPRAHPKCLPVRGARLHNPLHKGVPGEGAFPEKKSYFDTMGGLQVDARPAGEHMAHGRNRAGASRRSGIPDGRRAADLTSSGWCCHCMEKPRPLKTGMWIWGLI